MDLFKQKLKEKTDGEYPEGYVCGFVTRGIYQYALYGGHLGNKHKYIGTDNFETLKAGNAFNALGIRVRGLHVLALRYRDDKVLHGYTRYTGKDLEFTTKDHRGLFWPVISLPKQSMFNTNDYFKKQEEERQRAEALAAKKAAEQAAKQAAVNEAVLRRQKLMKKKGDN